jgi:hypothetical protein
MPLLNHCCGDVLSHCPTLTERRRAACVLPGLSPRGQPQDGDRLPHPEQCGSRMKILIAEDDVLFTRRLEAMLRPAGYDPGGPRRHGGPARPGVSRPPASAAGLDDAGGMAPRFAARSGAGWAATRVILLPAGAGGRAAPRAGGGATTTWSPVDPDELRATQRGPPDRLPAGATPGRAGVAAPAGDARRLTGPWNRAAILTSSTGRQGGPA